MTNEDSLSARQILFKELFVGSLIYVTVLGLLNDYTNIVDAKSFSTILFASIVLQILTQFAFLLKKKIINWLGDKQGKIYKMMMIFCVWLIMFLSKFVFIWVLDLLFGSYININGFFGILLVVVSVTIVHKLADKVFSMLGER